VPQVAADRQYEDANSFAARGNGVNIDKIMTLHCIMFLLEDRIFIFLVRVQWFCFLTRHFLRNGKWSISGNLRQKELIATTPLFSIRKVAVCFQSANRVGPTVPHTLFIHPRNLSSKVCRKACSKSEYLMVLLRPCHCQHAWPVTLETRNLLRGNNNGRRR
jgi:hypothetical protein